MVTSSDDTRPAGRSPVSSRSARADSDAIVGKGAFVLLLAYCVIEFTRVQMLLDIDAGWYRPALLVSAVLTLAWVRRFGAMAVVGDRLLVYFFMLTALGAAWIPFALNNFWAFQATKGQAMYLIAGTVPASLFLISRTRRMQFFNFWMLIVLYWAVFVLLNGGRGPGGVFQDENDMAFALCMGLPYPYFLAQQRGISKRRRVALYALVLTVVLAIIWTHSRGGFVGLCCVAMYMIYLSKSRVRNLFLCVILGLVALTFVPESYYDRIESITDTEDMSRTSRLTSWRIATNMFLDHPIVGVGPRNFPWHSGPYHIALPDFEPGDAVLAGRAAHSLYFTVLPEYGIVGCVLFGLLIAGMFRRLTRCERMVLPFAQRGDASADADLSLARAMKASLIGYLTTGTFISIYYYPELWYTLGFVIALSRGVDSLYSPAARA